MSHDDICSMGSRDVRMYHGMRLAALPWPLLHDLVQQQASQLGWRGVLLPFYLIFGCAVWTDLKTEWIQVSKPQWK
eukprot:CAMPEP_0194073920 /NCGR_PEP_ID=MMETSP0149-20130528/1134_1 /TAXON_ID=122233 /ORGANISM="Chaetoceros debilis, Strain MM31A-1" /LENGTH=75 /DNA_ID=CAMNT_0038753977 /DNA_START=400 /DNA_END=624 /DNA_ORIENTATION=+